MKSEALKILTGSIELIFNNCRIDIDKPSRPSVGIGGL
jgi:hypothetical protein